MTETERAYEQECEANLFAFCLLLDETKVREWVWSELDAPTRPADFRLGLDLVDDPIVPKLARQFGVSQQMAVIRLCQLGYFTL